MQKHIKLVYALMDLGAKTPETVERAQALLTELDGEWSRLIDLADHFRYLCYWRDLDRTRALIDRLEAVLWHFEDFYLN